MQLDGKVLVTGGAGFLGRALMATAEDNDWNCEFIIYSRDEQKQDAIKRRFKNRARLVLGDIRDTERLSLAMMGVDYVIHAGALKYIPEAEFNVAECHAVNVGGSISVIRASRTAEVPVTLAISTDKAVMPLNVYGATKMLMERLFVEADSKEHRFGVVRYGNVVGSTGSMIPVWQQQAMLRRLVSITDPDMTRFWMSASQAVELVLYAIYSLENGGETGEIVIEKAPSMRLMELFEAMELGVNHEIIGRRPGEKMDEALLSEYEAAKVTKVYGPYVHFSPLGNANSNWRECKAYESSTPDHWLEPAELRNAIAEAGLI